MQHRKIHRSFQHAKNLDYHQINQNGNITSNAKMTRKKDRATIILPHSVQLIF